MAVFSTERHPDDADLVARMDHELSAGRLAAVDSHLAGCEPCRAREDELRAAAISVRVALRSSEDDARHARARMALAGALDEEARRIRLPHQAPTKAISRLALAAAAALAMIVFANERHERVRPRDVTASSVPRSSAPIRALPIANITTGATAAFTAAQLCAGEHPPRVVPAAVARDVLRVYAMEDVPPDEYELDALITPELGGTVAAENLWPQRYTGGVWTAYVKDDIERQLHELVCRGEIDLATAQREMATDWIAAYRTYFHRGTPARVARAEDETPELVIATGDRPRLVLRLARFEHDMPFE